MIQIITLKLGDIKPSQPDDGKYNCSESPIEVCLQDNHWLIVHGNHRYYNALKKGLSEIECKIVRNPYLF